ncbi:MULTISPECIES: conjugative transfer signal peptidase TraF [unclassified Rhizobium]|uniref:conjugative transfer signal peptidase TraF n=1 Tax=unclassified Rhizobium TaxID=2613769 RepID=UPI001ADCE1CA|nr:MULTISPECIES: conjugative transfer signal peptidase TraF [unclassified Rhizobium]MBO9101899.1 conjugative transfer signal peptidase TraF [Rhizobium sp. L58/93]MBO9172070.1 conjugative transfer signal peptidase TraF [Rhizobium sp. L245/93]QXZ88291.1 conjugative transfer signal peptidase TraF [Rhizobium sp. K1/93]QXZ94262.1 conjugative transfer signal peptidase TraF [Rhizobium sp. K15/93]QYA05648.1 conjugative transfer signal peptidase TraF [Rhizobium sp. B21/90]
MSRRKAIVFVTIAASLVVALAGIAFVGGIRLNLTPSEPLGIWRIEPLSRAPLVGDLVFICTPPTPPFQEAWQRGYLRRGLCAGGFAPLIKTVVALPSQHVAIGDIVKIDGVVLDESRIRESDGQGRPIIPYSGGIVPPGHVFLHSSFASSYDSRYFGPVPDSGLLGLARPILTFGP